MLDGRRVFLGMVIALAACLQGCGWLCFTGGVGGAYVATGPATTDGLTTLSGAAPMVHVEDAVKEWLNRGQLPLPVLADGMHGFRMRSARFVPARGAVGARVVELMEGDRVVAEYAVAWDRQPPEYRLLWARNLLYEGELDVSRTPVLKTYDVE